MLLHTKAFAVSPLFASTETTHMDPIRRVIALVLTIAIVLLCATLFIALWVNRFDPVLTGLVVANFAAIVGLPFAAMASFVVVTLLRQSEQPIEFEGLGFKFKGASGEIVLWVFCFLATSGALHLLWRDPK